MITENEESRRVINDIWTKGTPPAKTDNARPGLGGTITRPQGDNVTAGDADLPADSDEDNDDKDDNLGGVPWDDPDFQTPSSIKVTAKTFSEIEWMRPPVRKGQEFINLLYIPCLKNVHNILVVT